MHLLRHDPETGNLPAKSGGKVGALMRILHFAVGCAVLAMGLAEVCGGQSRTASELSEIGRSRPHELAAAIRATFKEKDLNGGTAWTSQREKVFFAIKADAAPELRIDGKAGPEMQAVEGTKLWWAEATVTPAGKLHGFDYLVAGARLGGSTEVGILGPEAELQPGVPSGVLSAKQTLRSKSYDGMTADYWVYVPAKYDPKTPAALMVFQDGEGYTDRDGNSPILNMIDNLIAAGKIPVMICVFVNPGDISGEVGTPTYQFVKMYSEKWHRSLGDSIRSTEYDTVSNRYPRYLRDEVLAKVGSEYNIRKDSYSRAITGLSSGGICAFNAAWQMPEQFSRVLTWFGSFTSIQWKEDAAVPDGGQDYPEKVLREPHRNIRVWMQDGSNDLEWNQYGSWALANIRMANAMKLKDYDFHLSFGLGGHNTAQGVSEFPESMIWLWRDYDPARKEQDYTMEPSERPKPQFRVSVSNRTME